jgi:purine-binding chemotaxis protein CheW
VSEVATPQPPFARVPRSAAAVRGAMNLRGRVVALVELAPLVGLASPPLAVGQGQVLVLDRERRTLGLLVDGVLGVEPVGEPERPAEGMPVRGRVTVKGAPVAVLDADALAAAASRLFGDWPDGRVA